ncbi:hypothetical protein SAMN02745223_02910 [Devosia limi DSM 17137]|uniref:Uncharacterized protein n=1 Tax=Devosia limi DSM 17137 TaxID=1121477 RepID=A0A1M5CGP4_9HYPH|nr:hypothetical protein SAMN02745223_02910 [Devosia limi DSM 17137]
MELGLWTAWPTKLGPEPFQQFGAKQLRVQFLVGKLDEAVKVSDDHDASVLEPRGDGPKELEIDVMLTGTHK